MNDASVKNVSIQESPIEPEAKTQRGWRYFLWGMVAGVVSLVLIPVFILIFSLISQRIKTPAPMPATESELKSGTKPASYFYATISTPEDKSQFLQGDEIRFYGFEVKSSYKKVSDAQEIFWKERMRWKSSIDGEFGRGDSFNYRYLNPGTQTITFQIEDDKGEKSFVSRQITIRPDPMIIDEGADKEAERCQTEQTDSTRKECLANLIEQLTVWNRPKALEIIDLDPIFLRSSYEWELSRFARSALKPELCEEINSDRKRRDDCFEKIALYSDSPLLCERAGARMGDCYYFLAGKMQKPELCEKAQTTNQIPCREYMENQRGKDPFMQ